MSEHEFISLLNQHQKIIHKICRLYMNDAHDREDLFQEITLQAWKAFGSFRGDSLFSTWLYRVALNTAITFFRKEKRKLPAIQQNDFPETIDIMNEKEEQLSAMQKAIASLSKVDKALVTLYLEDYSYIHIGEMLGITPNNVAVKMNRIKTKLKEETQKHYQL